MSRKFTTFAAALLVILGMAGSAMAQDDANIIRPITKQGSAAFLFTIQGLGTFGIGSPGIGSGSGVLYGAGMKYYISDDLALRILLALNNTSTKTTVGTTSVTATGMDFGIGVGAEMHFRPLYSTSPYVGAQIGFASGSTDNGGSGASQVKTSSSNFGINVLAGFDWFWTRGIAMGAEYGVGFTSSSGTTTTGGTSVDNPSSTMIGISNSGNVHLVVYF